MELKLYDTLTREKRPFVPLDPQNERMYVCGPTVYDFAHIGNARPVIVFDVLFRLLRHLYGTGHVTYVRNITDVDDKINARAAEEYPDLPLNEAIRKVTEKTDKQFHEDVVALGCLPPTFEPRATEHIGEMKTLIERLLKSGNAYVAEDNVLFSVPSMPDYGQLSKRPLDEMIMGARVEVTPYKRNELDFVLWKPSQPGEPSWPSPAGIRTPGRPGWHIECSAMADKWLWANALPTLSKNAKSHPHQFDIHGGGADLIFPHHEDEIAQSRSAFHTPAMANYWVHNGFLEINGSKMSKSEGNFVTIRELLSDNKFGNRSWRGDVIRFAMLQTPHSHPIDWTVRFLEQGESRLKRWRNFAASGTAQIHNKTLRSELVSLLYDDLDTPAVFNLIDRVCNSEKATEADRYTVHWVLRFLGFRSARNTTASAVRAIGPAVSKISTLTEPDWLNLVTNLGRKSKGSGQAAKDTSLFLAFLAALGEVPELLRHYDVNNVPSKEIEELQSHRPNLYWSKPSSAVSHSISPTNYRRVRFRRADRERLLKQLRPSDLAKELATAIGKLSRLTVNDWNNLVETVRSQPRFSSGELKPETKLVLYLLTLAELNEPIAREVERRNQDAKFSKVLHELIPKIRPATPAREELVRDLVRARTIARQLRNFAESDRIRDELAKMGVVLKDTKDGTTWEIAR
jgi:cysteinyl-tRNA synthetase